MRSPAELSFRLRQEAANLFLLWSCPAFALPERRAAGLAGLPDPATVLPRLSGSGFAAEVERLAESILRHRFPLLGQDVDTGEAIAWRRDYVNHLESGLEYFRFVPYLDIAKVGDHKWIWELSRHQHLVLLAQAFRLTGREPFREEIWRQLESWLDQNPYGRGINWTSALEVAFRALSWIWIYHLVGHQMPEPLRARFLSALYRHGRYLRHNLSVYFSPNTHLLGEAVALHALGVLFPDFPGAAHWRRQATHVVLAQMDAQVRNDGSHFEQSSYYHVYTLDMFLFFAALETPPLEFQAKLRKMAEYLWALMGPTGEIPLLGDDDGGRFFHPFGARNRFGRATLAACAAVLHDAGLPCSEQDLYSLAAWWEGDQAFQSVSNWRSRAVSEWFQDAGVAVMARGDSHAVCDTQAFGTGHSGHSHAHALSLVCRTGETELLIDPGTFSYVDPRYRNEFRGTAGHNTVRINGADQAHPAGLFRWDARPATRVRGWVSTAATDFLSAECRQRDALHWRRILFVKPHLWIVLDQVEGPGYCEVEQFWHFAQPVHPLGADSFSIAGAVFGVDGELSGVECLPGWRSLAYGHKQASTVVRVSRQGPLPMRMAAWLDCSGTVRSIRLRPEDAAVRVLVERDVSFAAVFPSEGVAFVER